MDVKLSNRVLELLASSPKLKAKEIAARLSIDRSSVNSLLYGGLSEHVSQDQRYRWSLKSAASVKASATTLTSQPEGPLTKLCRYYLDCISRDSEIEISEFARSEFRLRYFELSKSPFIDNEDPFSTSEAREFLRRARQGRSQIYLGYPLRLRFQRARSGWEGYKIDPLLLFPFRQELTNPNALPSLSDEAPVLNATVLKSFPRANSGNLIDEIILMSECLSGELLNHMNQL